MVWVRASPEAWSIAGSTASRWTYLSIVFQNPELACRSQPSWCQDVSYLGYVGDAFICFSIMYLAQSLHITLILCHRRHVRLVNGWNWNLLLAGQLLRTFLNHYSSCSCTVHNETHISRSAFAVKPGLVHTHLVSNLPTLWSRCHAPSSPK